MNCGYIKCKGPVPRNENEDPRPIVVALGFAAYKAQIFVNIGKLKGNERWNKVHLTDDLTPEEATEQRNLRELVKLARKEGKEAKMSGRTAVIEKKRITVRNLTELPEELNMELTKTVRVQNGIAFQGKLSYLRNWHMVPVCYKDKKYKSAEHAYHSVRAEQNGDTVLALQIELDPTPELVKWHSHEIKRADESDRWKDQAKDILYEIVYAKFEQHDTLRKKLLHRGKDTLLFEATGDKEFGAGTWSQKDRFGTPTQTGKNKYGLLLAEVHEALREQYGVLVWVGVLRPVGI